MQQNRTESVQRLKELSDTLSAIEVERGGIEKASQLPYWRLLFKQWKALAEQAQLPDLRF